MEAPQLPIEHIEYRKKMAAWFKEQEAIIESDKIDFDFAQRAAEQYDKKAALYRVQAEANKEQLEADKARYTAVLMLLKTI